MGRLWLPPWRDFDVQKPWVSILTPERVVKPVPIAGKRGLPDRATFEKAILVE